MGIALAAYSFTPQSPTCFSFEEKLTPTAIFSFGESAQGAR